MSDKGSWKSSFVQQRRTKLLITIFKWLMVIIAVFFLGKSIADQWQDVKDALGIVDIWRWVLAVLFACAAVTISGLQQLSLLRGLGYQVNVLEWLRVFFAAQLGKYVPGTAWAYVSQMELSRRKGISRKKSLYVMIVGAVLTVLVSFVIGGISIGQETVSWLPRWIRILFGACGLAIIVLLIFQPRKLVYLSKRLLSLFHFEFPGDISKGSFRLPVAESAVASLFYGFHLMILGGALSPVDFDFFCASVGGYSTAWVIGFLAIIVPAGMGVREAILVAFLSPFMGAAGALTVAVLSRFLIIIAEAILAGSVPLLRVVDKKAPGSVEPV